MAEREKGYKIRRTQVGVMRNTCENTSPKTVSTFEVAGEVLIYLLFLLLNGPPSNSSSDSSAVPLTFLKSQ